MEFTNLGDSAVTIKLSRSDPGLDAPRLADGLRLACECSQSLAGPRVAGVVGAVTDIIPAFDSVTVMYDPLKMPPSHVSTLESLATWVRTTAAACRGPGPTAAVRAVEVPVTYGGQNGPDLEFVAGQMGVTAEEVIRIHSQATYVVAAVGFLPGFAYLTGLPARLQLARRTTPRTKVPKGSVAVGGPYTGIYPVASPGGWHILGATAMELFNPVGPAACCLRVGDRVRFVAGSA